jgi:AcrR family transcriptional regulator
MTDRSVIQYKSRNLMPTRPKSRRSETPEVRRRQILRAARVILAQQSYHELVLDDVARRAGLAKGTLYLYFRDKFHLSCAVMDDLMESLEKNIDEIVSRPKLTPISKIRLTIHAMLTFFDQNKDFLLQMSNLRPTAGAKKSFVMKERFDQHLAFLSRIVSEAVQSGDIRPHDPSVGAHLIIALVRMFMIRKVMSGGKPLEGHTDDVLKLYMNGLGTQSGRILAARRTVEIHA